MSRRWIAAVVAALLLCPVWTAAAAELPDNEIVLHVSPKGSDTGDGSEERPLGSLDGARQAVRKLDKRRPIRVVFHGGEYRMDRVVNFDQQDSGTQRARITYEAAEGEDVIFTGARDLDATQFVPVTDEAVLSRLPAAARDKVGQLDLRAQGIDRVTPLVLNRNTLEPQSGEDVAFFIDGQEQSPAQWPNGEDNYAVWDSIVSKGDATSNTNMGKGGVLKYKDANPDRWAQAYDMYLCGYFGYDYRNERIPVAKVDPSAKTITMAWGSDFGLMNDESKRYKAFNLLEELDVPGEWYVDRENLILYFYPPGSLANVRMQMTDKKDPFISITGTQYVTFRGITFEKTCGNAINMKEDPTEIFVTGCTFRDIGQRGVEVVGSINGQSQNVQINGAWRCRITDNDFINIGSRAVTLVGGNIDTLENGDNVIGNNYIAFTAQKTITAEAISIQGVGNIVEHNLIHNTKFHAVNFLGVNHVIRNNELYNVSREAYDAAVIYTGRSFVRRGTEIAYNYVHDYLRKDEKIGYDVVGVFLDDQMSGIHVHHNIFVNGAAGIQVGGGHDNLVENNTVIGMKGNIFNTDNRGETWTTGTNAAWLASTEDIRKVLAFPAYVQKFPELLKTLEDTAPPHRDVIWNNVSDKDAPVNERMAELGTVQNNRTVTDMSEFVDAAAGDYRLKSDSATAAAVPGILTDEFDKSQFGLQVTENRPELPAPSAETAPFKRLYPQNGATDIDAKNLTLMWQRALYADTYVVTIATDPDMQNVIFEKETDFNYIRAEGLESGHSSYYWTVKARNESGQFAAEWACTGVPYLFTTSQYDVLDKYAIDEAVAQAEQALSEITEGDQPGQYAMGTRDMLEQALAEANRVRALQQGSVTQQQLDEATARLNESRTTAAANIIKGFEGIDDMLTSLDNWTAPEGTATLEDGVVTFGSDQEFEAHSLMKPQMANTLCFKTKIHFGEPASWQGFMLRQADTGKFVYSTSSYLVAVKPDVLELQRFPGGILKTTPNTFFREGEWHDVQFGAIDSVTGTELIFRVDGKDVFRYMDMPETFVPDGHFGVHVAPNHSISLMSYGELPQPGEEPEVEDSPAVPVDAAQLLAQPDSWQETGGKATWADGGALFKGTSGEATFAYGGELDKNAVVDAEMVWNPGEAYQGMAIRAARGDCPPWSTDDYVVIVKKNTIELQRFQGGKNEFLSIVDNTYIPEGERVRVRFGAHNTAQGVRVLLTVDGSTVFDYTDAGGITEGGSVALYDMSGGGIGIYPYAAAEALPAPRGRISPEGTVYNAQGTGYSETGEWSSGGPGYAGAAARSGAPDATAVWGMNPSPGIYKMYYWKTIAEDGDPEMDLSIYASGDSDTFHVKVDCSRGEAGWTDIGTYYPSDGSVVVTLTGSGQGNPQATSIMLVKADTEDLAFSRLFESAKGALVLKIDSAKAALDRREFTMDSGAPVLAGSTAMVPLRLVAESFGATVAWEAASATATITLDGRSVAFVENEAAYTVDGVSAELEQGAMLIDGRMMIPLRAMAEAVGKQVLWDSSGVIVIADQVTLDTQRDADLLAAAAARLTE